MWTARKHTNGRQSFIVDDALRDAVRATAGNADCPEMSAPELRLGFGGFYCLRGAYHPGRHIALGVDGVMAAWPGDHRPRLEDLTD